jgi:hypothetical protein
VHFDYRIQNFKAFPDSGTLPLRPITLVYGPNSSGKSSIIQSILLLKQTLEEAENPETLLLPKGNLVDLGNYREFVHCHELSNVFAFTFSSTPAELTKVPRFLRGLDVGLSRIGVRISFGHDRRSQNPVIASLDVLADGLEEPVATYKPFGNQSSRVRRHANIRGGFRPGAILRGDRISEAHSYWGRYWATLQNEFNTGDRRHIEERIALLKRRLEPRERIDRPGSERANEIARRRARHIDPEALSADIQRFENIVAFYSSDLEQALSRFKETHKRSFLSCKNFLAVDAGEMESDDSAAAVAEGMWFPAEYPVHAGYGRGANGLALHACRKLREFLDDVVYLGPLREYPERHYIFSGNLTGQVGKTGRQVGDILFKNKKLLGRVNDQLGRFDLGYELLVTGEQHTDVFSLVLKDRKTSVKANILDVGFGISQVLPVVVQSMLSQSKLVCIEQPEIHLHPRLQADLGSLFVECIRKPYENRFLIETHSQHIMLRLQKLIRIGQLRPDELTVLYVDRGEEGAKCIELRLDSNGDFIDEWPGGFFEEGYSEIFA